MKCYLAGEVVLSKEQGWQIDALSKVMKRRLFSYWYHGYNIGNSLSEEVEFTLNCKMDLFLDSGAFSANEKGETISINRYADFIQQHGQSFSLIANLDVIGDGPKSWENLKALEAKDCKVVPVFHYEDDEKFLVKMLDGGYRVIALGGLVGASRTVLRRWLDYIWVKYLIHPDGSPRLDVHGFGLTDFELMFDYPWYSIDSTSWVQNSIYGTCVFHQDKTFYKIIFSDDHPSTRTFEGWHYRHLPKQWKAKIDKWLEPHGITAEQCASHYSFRYLVNATTFQSLETLGTDRFVKEKKDAFYTFLTSSHLSNQIL
jgi:hypothetical protein